MNKRISLKIFPALGAWFLLLVIVGFGHAQTEQPEAQAYPESMLFQDIPSVYGASKYEQKVTQAPSSISIITADEIKKYGYQDLADILNSVRGFYTKNDRNYEYAGIRGIGLPQDYNTRLLLLIDGHRQNDNLYYEGKIDNRFPLDIDLIERVEIIRGPSSSIYGTSAFLGVINVITKQGRDYKGLEASGVVGDQETSKSRLTYGNRFENGLEVLLSGSYYDSDGDEHLYYKEFDSLKTNHGIASDLDGEWFKNLSGKCSFYDFTLQGAYVFRKKDVPTAPYETLFNTKPMWTEDSNSYLDLKYQRTLDNGLGVLARIDYNELYYRGEYVYDWTSPGYFLYKATNHDTGKGRWVHGELQLDRYLLEKHRVTFGVEYQYDLNLDQDNYDKAPAGVFHYLNSERESWNTGAYLQDEFSIAEKVTLSMGLRYDYYATFGSTVNPRLAIIYSPFEKTIVKLLYGSAFRAPNSYELYFSDGSSLHANPNLDEETIDTYELIYEQYLGKNYRATVGGYYLEIDDVITQNDVRGVVSVFENMGKTEAYGLELEVEGKWEWGLEGRISYSCQRTENRETGEILPNSPKNLFKANLIIPLLREKIFLGIEEQYMSRRKTVYGSYVDEFAVTNLTLVGRKLFKGLELSASIYNLFDEYYKDPGAEEHRQEGIEQDGRTWRVKVTYAF